MTCNLTLMGMAMEEESDRNLGEASCRREIGLALEFERADEVARQPGSEPALDESEQPRGIANDVAEEPVHGPDRGGVEGEGAGPADLDAGEGRHRGIEGPRADAATGPGARQHPAPAAGTGAEVEAAPSPVGAAD